MAAEGLEGARATAAAFARYARDAPSEVARAGDTVVSQTAVAAAAAGRSSDRQSARVAATVRAQKGATPAVTVGGSGPAGRMLFGSEFGGRRRKTTRQFRPFTGRRGYWLWPTFRRLEAQRRGTYERALDVAAMKWGRGG